MTILILTLFLRFNITLTLLSRRWSEVDQHNFLHVLQSRFY